MKKLLRVFALFVTVAAMASLTSCSKDKKDMIIGTWQFEKASVSINVDDPEIQAFFDEFFSEEEVNEEMKGMKVEFKADNTFVTYDADGEMEETSTWTLDGDQLTIDGDSMTVKSLTKSTLILESNESYEEEGVSAKIAMTLEFKRF